MVDQILIDVLPGAIAQAIGIVGPYILVATIFYIIINTIFRNHAK